MTKRKVIMLNIKLDLLNKFDRMCKEENRSRSNMMETMIMRALQDRVSVLEQQEEK